MDLFFSYEEATLLLWQDEKYHQLMFDSYLELDPVKSALRYRESEEFVEICSILSRKIREGTVLDLGAGNGILSFALADCGYKVIALEPGDGAITGRKAIEAIQNSTGTFFEIIAGWGEGIPLNDASVDVVIARQVLHHAGDLQRMCNEVHRVLKPKGFFLALREHVVFKQGDLEIFLSQHPMHKLTGQENAFSLQFYKECMKRSGFSRIKVYAFWDTVLNYAPIKKDSIDEAFAGMLKKKIPFLNEKTVEKCFATIPCAKCLGRFFLKAISKAPGCLYTFEATK